MGVNIFERYGMMNDLHRELVNTALAQDKDVILKIIRRFPFKQKKGFRRIDLLPKNLMVEEIIRFAKRSCWLSGTILCLWYENKSELRNKVSEELNSLGYFIEPLNFDAAGIMWKKLNDEDLLDKDGVLYFAPKGKLIDNFNPTYVTLMSILHGWFDGNCKPTPQQIETENDNQIADSENNSADSENENSINSESDNLKSDTDKESSQIEKEIPKCKLDERFTEKFQQLEYKAKKYESAKSELAIHLKNLSKDIENDFYNENNKLDLSQLSDFKKTYTELKTEFEKFNDELRDYISFLHKVYKLEIYADKINYSELTISYLSNIIDKIKNSLISVLNENLKNLEEHFDDLDEIDKEELNEIFNQICNDVTENKIENFCRTMNRIDEMLLKISEMNTGNQISQLAEVYLQNKSNKCFNKLLKYVIKSKASLEEKFVFIYAACKDFDSCTFAESSAEIISKEMINCIEKLSFNYGNGIYNSILQDVDLINLISKTESGKKYLILVGIYLALQNQRDSAVAYIRNNKKTFQHFENISLLIERIIREEDYLFSKFSSEKLLALSLRIDENFKNDAGRYKKLSTIKHKVLKDIINNKIFPYLEKIGTEIKTVKTESRLAEIKNQITDRDFAFKTYVHLSKDEDVDSHSEEFIRKNCISKIDELKDELVSFAELRIEEILSKEFPKIDDIKNEIEKIVSSFPDSAAVSKKIFSLPESENKENNLEPEDLNRLISEIILKSDFFALNFTNICCELVGNEIRDNDLLSTILTNADSSREVSDVIHQLSESSNYTNALRLAESFNLNETKLSASEDAKVRKIEELEKFLESKNFKINNSYYYYKEKGRYGLALKVISEDEQNQKELEKLSSEEISNILRDIKRKALSLKNDVFENKDNHSRELYLSINEGLSICEKISDLKLENKIELARKLIKEIEYLKINNDSTENLKRLTEEYDTLNRNGVDSEDYLKISIEEIVDFISKDNIEALGINPNTWNEIKDSRKDDIEILLDKWSLLRKMPTTYEDVSKHPKWTEIESNLIEVSKALGRICSLYLTNEDGKIGQEPFEEWEKFKSIPFVYTTKIKSPKCESLNQIIRIYILTEKQLESKSYLNRIRDHISERRYNLNSFSVIFLIGSREKLNSLNTNPATRDLPVLDELALKKIIFATEAKKLPKWEFTNLLILTKNISDIQPFKSEGSINSEVNIFVGRDGIIREMSTIPKDFAIFGGRQIGKSSLLNEINYQLKLKGFKTVICAFQGYSDSMMAAKSILDDLRNQFKNNINAEFSNLDEFKICLKQLYLSDSNQPVAIFLDEVDELIEKESTLKEHKLIEIFRDISHETNHRWIFIFAGFKRMYLEISGKSNTYEGRRNPWVNFVDTSAKNLTGIDSPEKLVKEGLKNILGLEYDSEISKLIVNYSSGHPAFLQNFCQKLVEEIKDQIDHNNRRIYPEDVKAVFEKKDEFIKFVKRTLDMNLSDFQRLLVFVAADDNKKEFDFDYFKNQLRKILDIWERNVEINESQIKLELELLVITGVIKKSENNKYKFTHDYYLNILKRIEQIDRNVIEELLNKLS